MFEILFFSFVLQIFFFFLEGVKAEEEEFVLLKCGGFYSNRSETCSVNGECLDCFLITSMLFEGVCVCNDGYELTEDFLNCTKKPDTSEKYYVRYSILKDEGCNETNIKTEKLFIVDRWVLDSGNYFFNDTSTGKKKNKYVEYEDNIYYFFHESYGKKMGYTSFNTTSRCEEINSQFVLHEIIALEDLNLESFIHDSTVGLVLRSNKSNEILSIESFLHYYSESQSSDTYEIKCLNKTHYKIMFNQHVNDYYIEENVYNINETIQLDDDQYLQVMCPERITITCGNYYDDNLDVCNRRGQCVSTDLCECEENFFGDLCENTYCGGIQSDNESVCGGMGKCIYYNECICSNDTHLINGTCTTEIPADFKGFLVEYYVDCEGKPYFVEWYPFNYRYNSGEDYFIYIEEKERIYSCSSQLFSSNFKCLEYYSFSLNECYEITNLRVCDFCSYTKVSLLSEQEFINDYINGLKGIDLIIQGIEMYNRCNSSQPQVYKSRLNEICHYCIYNQCNDINGTIDTKIYFNYNGSHICQGAFESFSYDTKKCKDGEIFYCQSKKYYCGGYIYYDYQHSCSGNGECVGNDTCLCNDGFMGSNCEVADTNENSKKIITALIAITASIIGAGAIAFVIISIITYLLTTGKKKEGFSQLNEEEELETVKNKKEEKEEEEIQTEGNVEKN